MGQLTIKREGAWEAFALPLFGYVNGEQVCRLMNNGVYTCEANGVTEFRCHLQNRPMGEPIYVDLGAHEQVRIIVLQVPGSAKITIEPESAQTEAP